MKISVFQFFRNSIKGAFSTARRIEVDHLVVKTSPKASDLEHQLSFNDEKCHKFDYKATILGKNKAESAFENLRLISMSDFEFTFIRDICASWHFRPLCPLTIEVHGQPVRFLKWKSIRLHLAVKTRRLIYYAHYIQSFRIM